jgi:hypothetical protein
MLTKWPLLPESYLEQTIEMLVARAGVHRNGARRLLRSDNEVVRVPVRRMFRRELEIFL